MGSEEHGQGIESVGWGARIRTWEWRNQNPLPYHLATPHRPRHVELMLRMDAGRPAAIPGRPFGGNPGHTPARQAVLAGQRHGRYNARSPDAIPWD